MSPQLFQQIKDYPILYTFFITFQFTSQKPDGRGAFTFPVG
ncbi:hypothetical protein BSSX_4135 [Bacillus subtilis]|nr:hypothetical protein BSSX_4135 [Bacillus subtilis]